MTNNQMLTQASQLPARPESHPHQRVKLIFNPNSGSPAESPAQLQVILGALQAINLLPEVHLVEPEHDIRVVVKDALRRGHRLFVACGGDGTIDTVAAALAGTRGTLGIVPAGTRNNVAFSLGIPDDPRAAVDLLRTGRRMKIDVGLAVCGSEQRVFLEAVSVGLLSALFPATDDIQHGNWARLGDLLGTLIASPVAEIKLVLDGQPAVRTQGHIVVVTNMLYVGPRFRVDPGSSLDDGLLDVVVYAELSKIDLLGNVLQAATGGIEDERILRYKVQKLVVDTNPQMPIVVDGFPMGEGSLRLSVRRQALNVIAAPEAPEVQTAQAAVGNAPAAPASADQAPEQAPS